MCKPVRVEILETSFPWALILRYLFLFPAYTRDYERHIGAIVVMALQLGNKLLLSYTRMVYAATSKVSFKSSDRRQG